MSATLAVPAKNRRPTENQAVSRLLEPLSDRDEVRLAAATALGQGFSAKQVGRALGKRLIPGTEYTDPAEIAHGAMKKLTRWMREDESFRDLIYSQALIKLDLTTPQILRGVAGKAIRGRVDAARLALELTGRHTPKGDQVVANVTVQIANIPRPERRSE